MWLVKNAGRDVAGIRLPDWLRVCGVLSLWPLGLLILVAALLYAGVWKEEIRIKGPFAPEANPPQHSLILTVPGEGAIGWWRQPLIGDTAAKPFESKLHLSIAGREMGPAHGDLETIRKGQTAAYSHRGSDLIFSLPPGLANSADLAVTLSYKVRPRPAVTIVLLVASLLMTALLYHARIYLLARRLASAAREACRGSKRAVPFLVSAPYVVLAGLTLIGLAGAVLFAGASIAAWWSGWALPATAPLRWFTVIAWAARNEPYLGHLILTLAGFGTLTSWLAVLGDRSALSQRCERRAGRWLTYCGLPLGICAFLLCISAMWDGMIRAGDPHWANIGGLVPYSDAQNHIAAAFEEAKDGTLSTFAQRRPIGAAFRSVLLLSSFYSFPLMLIVQACLVASAACLASWYVMMWRGVWAGLAFFGFVYIFARTFAPTSLTEPLGLFWSLLSIPFLAAALRANSARAATVGIVIASTALMIRMGSMFTIPALLIWLVWRFGRGVAAKARLMVLATVLVACVAGLNLVLSKGYGTRGGEVGSNFSYVICGLTMGTTWVGCRDKLASDGTSLTGDEASVANKLYSVAWENFRSRPDVFVRRIAAGAEMFAEEFPTVLWFGHGAAIGKPAWLFSKLLTVISLIGLVWVVSRRAGATEYAFWLLAWNSIVASAALIYFDDGARTLAVSQPLMALFVAMGMTNPALPELALSERAGQADGLVRFGCWGLLFSAILFACMPWIAHRFPPVSSELTYAAQANEGEALVLGGRQMSGFLVVDNDKPLPANVAAIHLDAFEAIVRDAGITESLLRPVKPPTPFGFVYAPRLERLVEGPSEFIVPAAMMEHPQVRAWRLSIRPLQAGSSQWFLAEKGEAWSGRGN
jgi:hypothetical protein